jgi:hypothetical protein
MLWDRGRRIGDHSEIAMTAEWEARADAELARFDVERDAAQLRAALQDFRLASTRERSAERRRMLAAGRRLAERAKAAVDSGETQGDLAALTIEAGLFLLEVSRRTVAESGAPTEMLPDWAKGPDDRLGPSIADADAVEGLMLMTQGFARARRETPDHPSLEALRRFILDNARPLVLDIGEIRADTERLSRLVGIFQVLGDVPEFTFAITRLSTILREAKRPDVAETVLRKALEWGRLGEAHRAEIEVELASSLSEQKRFAEAEEIQRRLLDRDP